jgi:Ca2+-binding RTX toxin-like protein
MTSINLPVEPLESRTLLSFSVRLTLHDGVLTIDATRPRNSIVLGISEDRATIVLNENQRERRYSRADVRRITINGGRRGDNIECQYGTPVPVTINARGGDDYLAGGNAADRIDAGPGDDIFADNFGADVLIGGAGNDSARFFNRQSDLTITLDGRANDGQQLGAGFESMNVGRDIERVTGGQGNDRIVGNSADNLLDGYTGDDTLDGGAGNDTLDGNLGNDVLTGGDGRDSLIGGAGDDTCYARDSVIDNIDGGLGTDRAQLDRRDVRTDVEVVLQ